MTTTRVAVIGAGMGGLAAAIGLAARGIDVVVLERAATPGGKMREVAVGEARIDGGPTVFTMRWVFDALFAEAGTAVADHLTLQPVEVLARHAWSDTERLDLFADIDRSADAIGAFAGPGEARGYRDFCARARRVYDALEGPFMCAPRPNAVSLVRRAGARRMLDLARTAPFSTLWQALGANFADPRLRQLFGRYSTYTGASPFAAPAILMLIAHVEQQGVWLVAGGMHRLAQAMASIAMGLGARIRYDAEVAEILVGAGRARGVRLASGEEIAADAVVANADVNALASGRFGTAIVRAAPGIPPETRSLSAVTWTMTAPVSGFPLLRHNVFFSRDYPGEFEAIFRRGHLPDEPTVYVCAQDRDDTPTSSGAAKDRLLCLVNAPATGDRADFATTEIEACETRMFRLLARCGLTVDRTQAETVVTTPADFERLFPATGGALYGQAVHGPMTAFQRAGSRSRLPGLYLAGGSVHPGPGVPMATLSGRLAATQILADLGSTSLSRRTPTAGGMSTR